MTIKNKLKAMLIIEVALIVIHKYLQDSSVKFEISLLQWHYILALVFGVFIVVFALSIKCGKCNARQVFRGWSIFDLRLPEEKCYKCGEKLN